MKLYPILLLLLILLPTGSVKAAPDKPNTNLEKRRACWIAPAGNTLHSYGVFNFRKSFRLNKKPRSFIIYISADNNYRLFVNGTAVCRGPQLSDSSHWKYDTIDLAPYLTGRINLIAAWVCNQGEHMAWSQTSVKTGFFIEGKGRAEGIVNTDASWKVALNKAIKPVPVFILPPNEEISAANYPWGWEKRGYNDALWEHAVISEKSGIYKTEAGSPRKLEARNLPFAEEIPQRFLSIRKMVGAPFNDHFIKGTGSLAIGAGENVTILIDQGSLTTAFPEINLSGGKNSKITITYSESLYNNKDGQKGDRNKIKDKHIKGNQDIIISDGSENRAFTTLHYRTFRYVELSIVNPETPLLINSYKSTFTAYPFKAKASFVSNDPVINKIWSAGWHTARLCAYQTFMDCPYYEQLQYIGDTRIQALISLYVSGDDRLMKNAIKQFYDSRLNEGITLSRYPSHARQIIPPFSLFWIGMIHDHWMLRKDDSLIRAYLPAIKSVLQWHEKYLNERQMLGRMPYWNFVDWPKEWPWKGSDEISGIPKGALEGNSSILTLQYVLALQNAADLFLACGDKEAAKRQLNLANTIKQATYRYCWDAGKDMLADTPDKTEYSQHANIMAVLTDALPFTGQPALLKRIALDTTIVQCTLYYRFYMNQAFKKAGLAGLYTDMLGPWAHMLNMGLTTFAERPEPTRSDCHGWSASPTYGLLANVCGIEPLAPGFAKVKISPHLGKLKWVQAKVSHPNGIISIQLNRAGSQIAGEIELPKGIYGEFFYNGKNIHLRPGKQIIKL